MQLAALDPSANVVYLARPCQFSPEDLKTVCEDKYWSTARYSTTVIRSLNAAISKIKLQAKAPTVNLIGYSGGGALVVLIAAQRQDVASIRTVAGNLDLTTMDKIHNTSPLIESIDPITIARQISHIPQKHFCGAKDKVVPPVVAKNFVQAAGLDQDKVLVIEDASHNKAWDKHWKALLEYVF